MNWINNVEVKIMPLLLDPITIFNLVVCIVIVIIGIAIYLESKEALPLFIGAAFGLFGISHAMTILGLDTSLTIPLIVLRAIAYLLVIYAMYMYLCSVKTAKKSA